MVRSRRIDGLVEEGLAKMSRQEKRKELKKQKRKQQRQLQAALVRQAEQEEEAELDQDAVSRQQREEEGALARERAEHEEQERLWLLREEEAQKEWLRTQEEEAERKRKEEERRRNGEGSEEDLEEGWEYVEDGPAEIIWQGNEIIVKKPRKKVRKGSRSGTLAIEEKKKDGPISNPLPPQSAAFSSYQADGQYVADHSSNFGTEKDQRNCPFYIKTGVCRFGVRCSRLHPVFNEACTLLMRSMYAGAGLALEPIESLEYTDEEVIQDYEEFYDDVHSEFIQFGEIVNFKVCRNSSAHLRGNVYVHYVSQESAMAAYNHMNGRFYAKKQISCEFVGVHKWKQAICGEFMRTFYKTCSHGTACNFLHCFENPGREYEWADSDRPPPRFWQRKMATLFGDVHSSDAEVDEKPRIYRESTHDTDRGRHRDDRESTYDDDRRRERHRRDSTRRSGSDREHKYYYKDETKDRTRRASSKHDDGRRRRSKERSCDSRRREKDTRDFTYDDDSARDRSARRSTHADEPVSINDERWIAGDENLETDAKVHRKDRRRDRHHRDTTHDLEDDGGNGAYCPTPDHVSHHSNNQSHSQNHRHSSRRRSRSPSSHGTRSYYPSGEEQEDGHCRETRSRRESGKESSSKESKRYRHAARQSGDDVHESLGASDRVSDMLERSGDEVVGKSHEHFQKASKIQEPDDIRSHHPKDLEGSVAETVSDESANLAKLETPSGFKSRLDAENLSQEMNGNGSSGTVTGLRIDISVTDDVQKSTSEWQSWRKTKKVKLGLKDKPMRIII